VSLNETAPRVSRGLDSLGGSCSLSGGRGRWPLSVHLTHPLGADWFFRLRARILRSLGGGGVVEPEVLDDLVDPEGCPADELHVLLKLIQAFCRRCWLGCRGALGCRPTAEAPVGFHRLVGARGALGHGIRELARGGAGDGRTVGDAVNEPPAVREPQMVGVARAVVSDGGNGTGDERGAGGRRAVVDRDAAGACDQRKQDEKGDAGRLHDLSFPSLSRGFRGDFVTSESLRVVSASDRNNGVTKVLLTIKYSTF